MKNRRYTTVTQPLHKNVIITEMGRNSKKRKAALDRIGNQKRKPNGKFGDKLILSEDEEEIEIIEEFMWRENGEVDDDEEISDEDDCFQVIDLRNIDICVNEALKWNPDITFTRFGESRRSLQRRKNERVDLKLAAQRTKDIRKFMISTDVGDDGSDTEEEDEKIADYSIESINRAIQLLKKMVPVSKNARKTRINSEYVPDFYYLQRLAVLRYFQCLLDGIDKIKASVEISSVIYKSNGRQSYKSRCIREWAQHYLIYGSFESYKQGKHRKTYSVVTEESVKNKLREYLKTCPVEKRTPANFTIELNSRLLATIENAPPRVCEGTARRWMIYLGFSATEQSKGFYVDGHERPDVVAHRKEFLIEMEQIERKTKKFDGIKMDIVENPTLQEYEKEMVFITHDETTVYSNDAKKVIWLQDGEKNLRPKSSGRSLMISGFICECHGFLSLDGKNSFQIIEPGKNHDGYWTNDNLVNQLQVVIPLFEATHPNCDLVFAFDNSQNHHAYAPDALVASRMVLKDGGKNAPLLRNGYYHKNGELVLQPMQLPDGSPKGIRTLLTERGIRADSLEASRRILSEQDDFKSQKAWLQEILQERNHKIIFFPKFHCELNYIERIWAFVKNYLRRHCTFSFSDLQAKVPEFLSHLSLDLVRKVSRHCYRIMEGYRRGLVGPVLEYAVRKYKGHRRIPCHISNTTFEEEYKNSIKK